MKTNEPFVQKFMRFTGKLAAVFGPADRTYDDPGNRAEKEDTSADLPARHKDDTAGKSTTSHTE